jgi:hypothetical protein
VSIKAMQSLEVQYFDIQTSSSLSFTSYHTPFRTADCSL